MIDHGINRRIRGIGLCTGIGIRDECQWMSLLMQDAQCLIDLRRDRRQVQSVEHRKVPNNGAAYKGGPIEGVGMNQVKFLLSSPQVQKEFKEEMRLHEKTCISGLML